MKTFAQYLKEMALRSYRTDFLDPPNKGEEGFYTRHDGKKDSGSQVYRSDKGVEHAISSYFSRRDRTVISHPRTTRSLEQRLSRSGYEFNILFLEDRRALTGSDYTDQVEEFMERNGIAREGHITFVKNGTSGHVMTPWMILHTLGHAVSDHCDGLSAGMAAKSRIASAARNVMGIVSDSPCGGPNPVSARCREAFGRVFAFKSAAREDSYSAAMNQNELVHELMAEFLWNGDRIRVKPPYDLDEEVTSQILVIEGQIGVLLRMCVGRIIFDYYDG